AITSELPILIYYAVTWNNDGYPVLAVRMTYRPLCAGRGNLPRQVFVGTSLAVRYTQQLVPDALLERRTRKNQGNRKPFQVPPEVLLQLLFQKIQVLVTFRDDGRGEPLFQPEELVFEHPPVGKFQKAYSPIVCSGHERPERTLKPGDD